MQGLVRVEVRQGRDGVRVDGGGGRVEFGGGGGEGGRVAAWAAGAGGGAVEVGGGVGVGGGAVGRECVFRVVVPVELGPLDRFV